MAVPGAVNETASAPAIDRAGLPLAPASTQAVAGTPALDHVDQSHGLMTEGERLFHEARDDSALDPLNWSVHINKSRHRLTVYYKGRLYRTYRAVFGRSRWAGGKEWEDDGRTPEGDYLIIGKHRSRRFDWFLHINYPNASDVARYEQLRATHEIPPTQGIGGQIGIHGTDNLLLNNGEVNWTTGCVSVADSDIDELARLLPVGTLVVIKP